MKRNLSSLTGTHRCYCAYANNFAAGYSLFSVVLTAAACGGGGGGGNDSSTSAPAPVTLAADDADVSEDGEQISFIVRIGELSDKTVRIDYATRDDSAVAGVDYVAQSGTLTFPPGELSRLVTVSILDDSAQENVESFYLDFSNPVNVSFDSSAKGTIRDDDTSGLPLPPDQEPAGQANIIVIFTDDQRFDTLPYMPVVSSRLLPRAVEFTQAYVPTPLCCPARASTYSGGFLAQNTSVLNNRTPNGGTELYDDAVNIGTNLQGAGYETMFVGKWLNDYVYYSPYVPPGWNNFLGRNVLATESDWSEFRYIKGSSNKNSSAGSSVDATGQYHVYFERDQILNFIDQHPQDRPFFIFWAPTPPHPPATPGPGDQNEFGNFSYRGRGFGEEDLSDKPQWLLREQGKSPLVNDVESRNQLRSLLSVDRSLGDIIDKLEAQGVMDKTVFVYTSDNGYMWGEHGLWGKNKNYEESVRVPLFVVKPGVIPRTDNNLVYAVLDLGPTLYELAGLPDQKTDGRSLLPLLNNPNIQWRNELFFEKYNQGLEGDTIWAGVRRGKWKYISFWTGEEELYDLEADPYELDNLANVQAQAAIKKTLADRTDQLRGLAIPPTWYWGAFDGVVDKPFSFQFEAVGGKAPLRWTLETGSLPDGITLNPATGELSGTPSVAGVWPFTVRVTGSGIARQSGRQRTFIARGMNLNIAPQE